MKIEIKGVTKDFEEVKAINDLSITIESGVTGLIGQNGAGKSTLLRMIAGVITPTSGEVYIDDELATSLISKKKVFFLPDTPYIPSGATINDLLKFYGCFYNFDVDKINQLLSLTTLDRKRKISTFSKGMQRQTFLILTVCVDCPIILIDEGFDGLDPLILELIKKELINLGHEGKLVLLASHNLSALQEIASRYILLSFGRLGKEGEEKDYSTNIVKYQVVFNQEVNERIISSYGINVILYKQVGRILTLIIIENDEGIKKMSDDLKPLIIEKVPLEKDEIFMAQMKLSQKEMSNGNE